MQAFEPARIGSVTLRNRVLRSATFEGTCDPEGRPTAAYLNLYRELAGQGVGALITGFAYTSTDGRAMQPGQAGLESDAKAAAFGPVTEAVHQQGCPIFVQLAHAGRQTSPTATGGTVYGPSARKSSYFNSRPCSLTTAHIERLAREFAAAARRAREAGFDGVQLHAAHGYLIHQFLSPAVNDRNDIGSRFPTCNNVTEERKYAGNRVGILTGLGRIRHPTELVSEMEMATSDAL